MSADTVDAVALSAEPSELAPITGRGPLRGLAGLTGAELRRWFPWRGLLFAAVGVGWMVAMYAIWLALTPDDPRLSLLLYPFFAVWAALLILYTVATTQGAMANEIEDGTAAWVVAKPVGRPAFVLSKFLATVPGLLIGAIALPGAVGRLLLQNAEQRGDVEFRAGEVLELLTESSRRADFTTLAGVPRYLGTLALIAAAVVFMAAVMILLGCVITSRAGIFLVGLAVPAALLILGRLGPADVVDLTPAWVFDSLVEAVADNPAPVLAPMLVSAAWSLGIVGGAMWWFSRKEL